MRHVTSIGRIVALALVLGAQAIASGPRAVWRRSIGQGPQRTDRRPEPRHCFSSLAAASPEAFTVVARAQILPGVVRASPAIAGGLLYVRNENTVVCLDLRK